VPERADVLGQATAAESQSRLEEPVPDAVVKPERFGEHRHVGAGRLAHLGHRVDVRDLGGQERVRGDLHQLGRGEIRDQNRHSLIDHRAEDPAQFGLGVLALDPEDQAIRVQGVFDGEPLAQELGVPRELDVPRPGPPRR